MTRFLSFILLFITCFCFANDFYARKIKSKLPIKVGKTENNVPISDNSQFLTSVSDSSANFNDFRNKIKFYGFDKTASSSIESFFVSNQLNLTLKRITLEITYFDLQKRQLHSQSVSFDCDIPSGETRRQDIKSWDTQKAFYFFQSAKPRRQATPFSVSFNLKSVEFLTPESTN